MARGSGVGARRESSAPGEPTRRSLKMTFAKALVGRPSGLSTQPRGNTRRAIDIHEGQDQ